MQKKYISLYKTKYETVSSLLDRYVMAEGRTDAEKMIYKKVVTIIDELRNEIGNSHELKRIVDNDLNGIITRLHAEIPGLNKKDHTLFGYMALGFDATIISHFMDCTTNSIYIRKSRMKKVIEESEAEHKEIFLEIMM